MMRKIVAAMLVVGNVSLCMDHAPEIDPLQDKKSSITLLQVAGSDLCIANSARVSYNRHSDAASDADAKLIEKLLKDHHETPFEQTFLQFHVKLPIFVARHWMRHRIGVSYNEKSARYTHMEQEFYVPTWRAEKGKELSPEVALATTKEYEAQLASCSALYEKMLASGVKRELARGILPVSLYTEFVFGCNMRSLLHFVELRAEAHAQWEIQQYAKAMLKMAHEHFPITIKSWCALNNITWLTDSK